MTVGFCVKHWLGSFVSSTTGENFAARDGCW